MKTRIVRIGNSQGVRIPKLLLEQAQDYQIVIRSTKQPRQNWEVAFKAMAERGHDRLFGGPMLTHTKWDEDEWEW